MKKRNNKYDSEKIVGMYTEGLSIYSISEILNIPRNTVRRYLQNANISKTERIINGEKLGEKKRPVYMLHPKTREVMARFESQADAYRYFDRENKGGIRDAINTQGRYMGYYWRDAGPLKNTDKPD